MRPSVTALREAFEAWWRARRAYADLRRGIDGNYADLDTEWAWLAFKAGAEAAGRKS